jgi:hypothetical protein
MQQAAQKKPITIDPFHEFILDCLHKSELGDARLFCHLKRDEFCYDHTEKRWYMWNDHFWVKDKRGEHFTAITDVIHLYETRYGGRGKKSSRRHEPGTKTPKKKNLKFQKI